MLDSALGERVFGYLVAGKKAQLTGSAALPHSFAYIEDVGRAAALLGTQDSAPGRVWIAPHAPAWTQGEMVEEAGRVLGTRPQFSVVDSSRIERAFHVSATPIPSGIAQTVEWYRSHRARSAVGPAPRPRR